MVAASKAALTPTSKHMNYLKQYVDSLKSTFALLRNKWPTFVVLAVLAWIYRSLPDNQPVPFAELLYAVILIASVTTIAPVIRLLVFNEAAQYAESGALDQTLKDNVYTPALVHYWFATAVCYLTTLLCVSSLLSS